MGGPKNDLVERLGRERPRRLLDSKLVDHVDDGFIDAPIHLGGWRRHAALTYVPLLFLRASHAKPTAVGTRSHVLGWGMMS